MNISLATSKRIIKAGLLAYLLFTLGDFLLRATASSIPTNQVVLMSSFYSVMFLLTASYLKKRNLKVLRTERPLLHGIRSIMMAISYVLVIESLPIIEMPLFYTLAFTLPIWTCLSGWLLNNESINKQQSIGIMVCFVGVLFALKPTTVQLNPATILVLLSMMLFGVSNIIGKWMPKYENPICLGFYPRLASLVILSPLLLKIDFTKHSLKLHLLLIGSALLSTTGLILLGYAYKYEKSSRVAPLQYSQLIWSTIITYLLLGYKPDLTVYLGAGLIMVGGYFVLKVRD